MVHTPLFTSLYWSNNFESTANTMGRINERDQREVISKSKKKVIANLTPKVLHPNT